jgi:50S ribosomal protein L16 3-hydroxylase
MATADEGDPSATTVVTAWFAALDATPSWRASFGREPFAAPGGAALVAPLLTWEVLHRVLLAPPPVDVLTVRAGELVRGPAPRGRHDVERLFGSGVSTVVRAGERHDPGLSTLATAFEAAAGGEAHVQLYATPGGTNSYGWHFDFEEVFIVQTAGTKNYYFRRNTVASDVALGDHLDFTAITRETSPIYAARLVPGDWLYIPSRWWHLVKCETDSLSISTGVMPDREFARARRVPAGWGTRVPPAAQAPRSRW